MDTSSYTCFYSGSHSKESVSHLVESNSWDPTDHSPPGSSVHGFLQARILEWVPIPFSRESSQPRDQTWVSCIGGRCFTIWATREIHSKVSAKIEISYYSLKIQSLGSNGHGISPPHQYNKTNVCKEKASTIHSKLLQEKKIPFKSYVYGILQVRILERVAMPSCRGSSQPRDWTCISCDSCISGRFLTTEPLGKPSGLVICHLYYAEVFSLYTQFIKNFYDTKSQSQN